MDIRTSEISFCNKTALNLTNDKFKAFLLNNLREEYNISITDRNAYILNPKSIRNLSKNPHLISLKTCGANYYLFMTCINEINYCFFIDKKIKNGYSYPRIIIVNYNFSKDIFKDTLVEGELIRDKDNDWLFLIFDIRCYKGVSQKDIGILNKIKNIYSLFDDYNEESIPCKIQVKKFFTYNEFDDMYEYFIPSLPYRVNGLFFNTLNTGHRNYLHFFPRQNKFSNKVKSNTSNNTHKTNNISDTTSKNIKVINNDSNISKDDSSRVFVIKKTDQPDVYNLYCVKDNCLIKYGRACVPTLKCSKFIRSIFINSGKDVDVKVKCEFNRKFGRWLPKEVSNVFFPDEFSRIKEIEKED